MSSKFKVGDKVGYHNRQTKVDIVGTIVAREYDSFYIEVESGDHKGQAWFIATYAKGQNILPERFSKRNEYWQSSSMKNKGIAVPTRSKCLYVSMKEYDPTQEGDRDDDV